MPAQEVGSLDMPFLGSPCHWTGSLLMIQGGQDPHGTGQGLPGAMQQTHVSTEGVPMELSAVSQQVPEMRKLRRRGLVIVQEADSEFEPVNRAQSHAWPPGDSKMTRTERPCRFP